MRTVTYIAIFSPVEKLADRFEAPDELSNLDRGAISSVGATIARVQGIISYGDSREYSSPKL